MAVAVKKEEENEVVVSAVLHAGVPFCGKTETHLNQAKYPGIKLEWEKGEGLVMELKGKIAFVPAAGVKIAYLTDI